MRWRDLGSRGGVTHFVLKGSVFGVAKFSKFENMMLIMNKVNLNSSGYLGVVRQFKQTLRLTIYISTILLTTLLFGFRLFTDPIHITGHLKRNPKDTSAYVSGITVFVKGDNKVLAKTITDKKGDFEITFTPNKEKLFDFFCHGIGVDTLLIASVKAFESDTPDMIFYIPGIRRKNILGKTICPKCSKTDKVYQIVYGDGIPDHFDDDKKSHTPNANPKIIDGEYYAGTCIVGVAKHFCERDKVEF